MSKPERAEDAVTEYVCEWVGSIPKCRAIATGYAGGPKVQHPLCAEHLDPKLHPPHEAHRLHPDEPITAPCFHVTGKPWPTRAEVME
jgi:hypothetical protein